MRRVAAQIFGGLTETVRPACWRRHTGSRLDGHIDNQLNRAHRSNGRRRPSTTTTTDTISHNRFLRLRGTRISAISHPAPKNRPRHWFKNVDVCDVMTATADPQKKAFMSTTNDELHDITTEGYTVAGLIATGAQAQRRIGEATAVALDRRGGDRRVARAATRPARQPSGGTSEATGGAALADGGRRIRSTAAGGRRGGHPV